MKRIHTYYSTLWLLFIVAFAGSAQHRVSINATLNTETKEITIDQEINYINNSQDTLHALVLHDWANSFSSKTTPLGKRFAEDFQRRFHFAKEMERGHTDITKITDTNNIPITWKHVDSIADIIKLQLPTALAPNAIQKIQLSYTVKLPSEKFTRYGYHKNGNFYLKHWFITPAVYHDGQWQAYSHKNLDDLYAPLTDFDIHFTLPATYHLTSELDTQQIETTASDQTQTIQLIGTQRNEVQLHLEQETSFYEIPTKGVTLLSNIKDDKLSLTKKTQAIAQIFEFLEKQLGTPYPHQKIIASKIEYKHSPVYGLNQLPDIIRPFPDGFQYEIKQLKTITNNFLDNTLLINPRYDKWIKDAIHIQLMIAYADQYYPDMKMIGSLSKIIGIRWFHAADIKFNDQYFIGYKNMARLFLDQPLTEPQDNLIKFNKNIANAYKAGIGLMYLEDYLEDTTIIPQAIKQFYTENKLAHTSSKAFEKTIRTLTDKDIQWFFKEYVATNEKIDFKIRRVKRRNDSLQITIKNKRNNTMPVSITGLRNDSIVSKTWVDRVIGKKKVSILDLDIDKLVIDYEQKIPEVNRRNNHKNLRWIFNKPLQFRFFQDIEDPTKSQLFYIPEFEFNVYDGITIASKFYNKTFIRRNFTFDITPSYAFRSKKLLGSGSVRYRHQIANDGLYQIQYGLNGSVFSYAPELLVRRFSPNVSFFWRPKDLRSNASQRLSFRSVNVFRQRDEENPVSTPDYSVFNARYQYSDANLIDLKTYRFDYQIAKNFSKISTTINYRKLFLNNRQLNLRFFAGTFIYNDTKRDGDFFSFALDRPTDYLFDFNYLGRSEDSGLVSQQIIIAEGGFKSQLDYPFANKWITTLNANTNIWNWIYAYGDVGFVKSKGIAPKFVYDAGIRLSLVADYFELFFPVASNNGFEIAQPNYGEKIRFIVTLSPQTLIGLFTRQWY